MCRTVTFGYHTVTLKANSCEATPTHKTLSAVDFAFRV